MISIPTSWIVHCAGPFNSSSIAVVKFFQVAVSARGVLANMILINKPAVFNPFSALTLLVG